MSLPIFMYYMYYLFTQVLAWRKDSSTAAGAEKMWSILGATNLRIAELLNAIANEATSTDTEGKLTFDATMKVCGLPKGSDVHDFCG